MTRKPVQSSSVKSIGYDQRKSLLEVEFHNGSVHQYHDVGVGKWRRLNDGGSVGSYINKHIIGQHRSHPV